MKFSIVKPTYKKGNKINPNNYRPIALLTSLSKVLEKALYFRVNEHLNTNNLLVGNQFGFRKGTATEDAILKLMNDILKALNNKTLAGSIFCDLEKAFDSVNHDVLLSKLSYYGISSMAKSLLKFYLQNRHQSVLITNSIFNSNTVSKWTKIKCGVPQGSILGPLLFILYIKNLPKAVKHKALPILFADDITNLITSSNSNQLQSDLNIVFAQLNKWFKSNSLFFNFDKTHFIQFNNASKCTPVRLDMKMNK